MDPGSNPGGTTNSNGPLAQLEDGNRFRIYTVWVRIPQGLPIKSGSAATMVVSCETVNLVLYGKHCWFESSRSHKCSVNASGQGKVSFKHLTPVRIRHRVQKWFSSSKEEQMTVNHQIGYRDSGEPLKSLVYGSALVWMPDCHSGDQTGSIPVYTAKLKSVLGLLQI